MARPKKALVFKFMPSALVELPSSQKAYGEILETVYVAISTLTVELLERAGQSITPPYEDFLERRLSAALKKWGGEIDRIEISEPIDVKQRWQAVMVYSVLRCCHEGHIKIDESWRALLADKYVEFVTKIAEASVSFGQMKLIFDLYRADVFPRIGSILSSLHGASLGGFRSAHTRRKQSQVPAANVLRVERDNLIEMGKPQRAINAMLAKKYSCTSDHVRKILKRD